MKTTITIIAYVAGGVFLFFGVLIFVVVGGAKFLENFSDGPEAAPAKEATETLAEKSAREKRNILVLRVTTLAASVKRNLRDPDSLVWEEMRANDDASVVCLEYRARNGFGGMNRAFVVYARSKISDKVKAYNQHCTQPLNDVKHLKYAV